MCSFVCLVQTLTSCCCCFCYSSLETPLCNSEHVTHTVAPVVVGDIVDIVNYIAAHIVMFYYKLKKTNRLVKLIS